MSLSRNQLIDYLKQIDITNKVVLDAGSGSKEHWARNWAKGEPKEYIALDSEDFGDNIVADLNEYIDSDNYNLFDGRKYDIIFCLETLEHLYNPLMAISNLYYLLKPGG